MFQNKPLLIAIVVLVLMLVIGPIIWGLTNKPTPDGGVRGRAEIVIWNLFDEEEAFSRMIQAYRQAHPGVQVTYRRFTNIDQYNKLLASELAEGKGPDIFAVHYTQLQTDRGKMVPMPIDHAGLTMDVFKGAFVPVAYQTLVFPETVKEKGKDITRDRLFAMPLYVDNLALFYNETMLEQYAKSAFPKTYWTGIVEQVAAITQTSRGAITRSGIALGSPDTVRRTTDLFSLMMLQFGGSFYNEDRSQVVVTNRINKDGRSYVPAAESLEFLTSFADEASRNYSWNDSLTFGDPEKEIAAFVRGDVAMIFGYSYYVRDIASSIRQFSSTAKTITNKEVSVAPMPQIADPANGDVPEITLADFYPLAVSRNSKAPDVAWDFLVFASQDEQMKQYFDRTKKPVSKRGLIDELAKANPEYEVFLRQSLNARALPIDDRVSYETMVLKLFHDILSKESTVEEAVGRLGKYLECSLGVAEKKPEFLDQTCTDN